MPVKGSIVGHGPWRDAVLAELARLKFDRTEPPTGLMVSPGFFWFRKGGPPGK